MARGNSTEDERQEVAEGLLGLPPKKLSIALEKLHSDYDINEWNDIYSKFMEINPQSQVRYNNPEELELSKMSEEDLKQGLEDIKRGVTDYTDAEEPVVTGWIKDELAKRKPKPKSEMEDFQKSLDDYAAKNKKGREDIPARYRK
jgi:hypothetical protein